jgi:hypothetical protein
MLRERDREMDKAKYRAEVNAKYEQKLNSLHEFQATLQQQFADYETALRNRYEKVAQKHIFYINATFTYDFAGSNTKHDVTPTAKG